MKHVEFKVKEDNVRWEDTGIIHVIGYETDDLNFASEKAYEDAKKISNERKAEVRWNHKGYIQGHYVCADYSYRLKTKGGMTE